MVTVLAIPFLLTARLSLHWRVMHDAPIMLYLGLLVEHFHKVPYRDFFDMNTPGTYFAFAVLGRLTGYADAALRVADLACLLLLMAATGFALRPFGWRPALVAPLLYGLSYMGLAQFHALQRESLMLVPIAAAIALLSPGSRVSLGNRALGTGLLLGVAATIKPAIVLDAAPFASFLIAEAWQDPASGRLRPLAVAAALLLAGIAAPLLACWGYLVSTGAFTAFVDIARNYWPLYGQLGALHETVQPPERLAYIASGLWAYGGHRWWLLPAVVGLWSALQRSGPGTREGRFVLLNAGLLVTHSLYPAASGQFWPYHWFPLLLSLSFASALCLVQRESAVRTATWAAPALILLLVVSLLVRPPAPLARDLAGLPPEDPYGERVREISGYLRSHLGANDTVQPLDWTGGAVDAMLRSRARLATPFVYDFHFYHHVSSPYIQQLRARFVTALYHARPTYVIRVLSRKPWVQGVDTSRDFPELDYFLSLHYRLALSGDGYQILAWDH